IYKPDPVDRVCDLRKIEVGAVPRVRIRNEIPVLVLGFLERPRQNPLRSGRIEKTRAGTDAEALHTVVALLDLPSASREPHYARKKPVDSRPIGTVRHFNQIAVIVEQERIGLVVVQKPALSIALDLRHAYGPSETERPVRSRRAVTERQARTKS